MLRRRSRLAEAPRLRVLGMTAGSRPARQRFCQRFSSPRMGSSVDSTKNAVGINDFAPNGCEAPAARTRLGSRLALAFSRSLYLQQIFPQGGTFRSLVASECAVVPHVMLSAVIVDDEQLAREELAYLLKSAGDVNVVAQGKNGLEAINLVREHNPDLLFLDVQMPGLDGFGVIKKLLDRKVPLPQIVFATAFDKKRIAQSIEKVRAKLDAGGEEKLETLVRMLEAQKPSAGKILIKAAGRLLLADPKDICFAAIEDGVITVTTSGHMGMEGQS